MNDENHIISCNFGTNIDIWNYNTNKWEGCFYGHKDTVYDILYTNNSKIQHKLFSGSEDKTLKFWDI